MRVRVVHKAADAELLAGLYHTRPVIQHLLVIFNVLRQLQVLICQFAQALLLCDNEVETRAGEYEVRYLVAELTSLSRRVRAKRVKNIFRFFQKKLALQPNQQADFLVANTLLGVEAGQTGDLLQSQFALLEVHPRNFEYARHHTVNQVPVTSHFTLFLKVRCIELEQVLHLAERCATWHDLVYDEPDNFMLVVQKEADRVYTGSSPRLNLLLLYHVMV